MASISPDDPVMYDGGWENLRYRSSSFDQFKALIIRNIIIKKREKQKTLVEFLMPLYFILILALVRIFLKETVFGPVKIPHDGAFLTYQTSNLLSETILISPNSTLVKEIVSEVFEITNASTRNIEYFQTEDELVSYYKTNDKVSLAVIFSDDPLSTPSYTIRVNPSKSNLVSEESLLTGGEQCRGIVKEGLENSISCPTNSYYESGFLGLQRLIDSVLINRLTNKTIVPLHLFIQSFPRNEYISTGKSMTLRSMVPLYMVFAWAQFIFYMMVLIVTEKEKKIKECMRMMGLQVSVYWLAWFSIYFVYVFSLAVISVVVLFISRVFQKANMLLLFILFLLYGVSSILLALMLTPFFSKAKTAGVVGQLVQIFVSLLYYLQVYLSDKIESSFFWVLGLLSPCAFTLAVDKVILFDFARDGMHWENIWEGEGLPLAGSLIMITVDIVLYLLMGIYFDCIIPGEFGSRRQPWFIFRKSTWTSIFSRSKRYIPYGTFNPCLENPLEYTDPNIESFPTEWAGQEAIRIRNLHKVFRNKGKKSIAVNGISMDVYKGQITAILGHNGAGKTTLINLLTGMQVPDIGKAFIWNLDSSDYNDQMEIRRRIGVCPQHDILFQNLTPKEHLSFYGKIKGLPSDIIENEITALLEGVDLKDKANSKACDLSGGQKRKLSIAIALIGDPPLLFLDEPTAGVDAYSRRKLWTLLTERKKDKVVFLTTHFMDEADILADRKAIITKGKLRCYGSSLFLKNRFGLGYHLTMVISDEALPDDLLRIIQNVIPTSSLVRHFGKELSFLLPSNTTSSFSQLFQVLDSNMFDIQNGQIESYGISLTNLEEVFLALNNDREDEIDNPITVDSVVHHLITKSSSAHSSLSRSLAPSHSSSPEREVPAVSGQNNSSTVFDFEDIAFEKNTWRCFKAVTKIRVLNVLREPVAIIFMTLFPLLFVCAGLSIAASGTKKPPSDESSLVLSTDMYSFMNNDRVLLYNNTGAELPYLESSFIDAQLVFDLYNGNYSAIYELQPHFSALDVSNGNIINGNSNITLRYNSTFSHILPILVNLIDNAVLSTGGDPSVSFARLQTFVRRLPAADSARSFDAASFIAPIMIGIAFSSVPASLVIDLIYDRSINARNTLRLNGVSFDVYFGSYLLTLLGFYSISYLGLLVVIEAFQVQSLVSTASFTILSLLYLLHMPAILLFSACVAYIFDNPETARQFYPGLSQMFGFISFSLIVLSDSLSDSSSTGQLLNTLFSLFIPYYLPYGAIYFINKVYYTFFFRNMEADFSDYMTTEIICMFVACLVHIPLFYVLLRVIDTVKLGGSVGEALWISVNSSAIDRGVRTFSTPSANASNYSDSEDEDVTNEKHNVSAKVKNKQTNSPAILHNVGKKYKKRKLKLSFPCYKIHSSELRAVKDVSFEVVSGSVFGLLGPNGAGKTSILRIMTAEERPTEGEIYVCGYLIKSSMSPAYQYLGYCPQHDSLWPNLTVDEHIECFANMNGVDPHRVKELINAYVDGLSISEHRKKRTKVCSGGTMRKLSYILSMIGKAKIILLDEPSTGMDPQSKRFLWNSILANFQRDRCAILTTHSMEEANALCSKIGILVKGQLKCLGSVQHLKSKYGSGYTLEMKITPKSRLTNLNSMQDEFDKASLNENLNEEFVDLEDLVKKLIKEKFPGAEVKENFEGRIIFNIGKAIVHLGRLFELLERIKSNGIIEEYSLSQTTLEQVFLHFARQQDEDAERETSTEQPRINI